MTAETYHTILVRKYVAGMASEDEQQEVSQWLEADAVNWSSLLAIAIVTVLNERVTIADVTATLQLPDEAPSVRVDHIRKRLHNLLSLIKERNV